MLEDLFSLIRIPSISAKPEHHDDMLACAERWAQLLIEAGADEALVMPSKGNPIVFGQKTVDPTAKTVLIYAHYDVMPAEPLELWKSEPFEPEIRDEHIIHPSESFRIPCEVRSVEEQCQVHFRG